MPLSNDAAYPRHQEKWHYANTPMYYTASFHGCKNDNFQMKKYGSFLIFAKNIDCGYTLEPPHEAVLTSTHNLCFRAKIRKAVLTSTHNLCLRAKIRK